MTTKKTSKKKSTKKTAKKATSKKSKRKAKTKKSSFSRNDALVAAIKKGSGTVKEIAQRSDELYCEQGGGSSVNSSMVRAISALPALESFGIVEKDGRVYKLAK